ncbi:MAG: hypothetical protein MUF54_19360, partial [Polyangiaceae bacterium]|nr:hypothetical protein [Polyangiaceae bacterium]
MHKMGDRGLLDGISAQQAAHGSSEAFSHQARSAGCFVPGAPPPQPGLWRELWNWAAGYLMGDDPTFWVAMVPMLVLSALLFTRHIASNYIFDEQEALLANPYVNGKSLAFKDAVRRDFWGLPPDRSVGSYRPLPNYVWRAVWEGQQAATHGANAVLVKSKRVVHALAPSSTPPQPLSRINLLSVAVALPTLAGLALEIARRRRGARYAAAALLLLFAALLAAEAPAWAQHWGGIGLCVALLLLTVPVWGICAVVPGPILSVIGHLPTTAAPPVMQPWLFHWLNVLFHAANGALLVVFVFALTRRRGLAWLSGTTFVCSAVLTEAVSGVVGIADVMGGLGALLALIALRLPVWVMPLAVFSAVTFGLFSKESALVCIPLVPFAAVVLA